MMLLIENIRILFSTISILSTLQILSNKKSDSYGRIYFEGGEYWIFLYSR